jgi:hypothetical protein
MYIKIMRITMGVRQAAEGVNFVKTNCLCSEMFQQKSSV